MHTDYNFHFQEKDEAERKKAEEKSSTSHIYNLNPDPMLTGMIVYLLKEGEKFSSFSQLKLSRILDTSRREGSLLNWYHLEPQLFEIGDQFLSLGVRIAQL